MSGAIMRRHVAVLGLDEHVAILVNENGAEGMIAVGQGAAGDIERSAQKMLVELGRTHIRKAFHGRFCRLIHHADGRCDKQGCGLKPDPEKHALGLRSDGWKPVFPRDKREAFARRSCSNKKIERNDDSKKSPPALCFRYPPRKRGVLRSRVS